MILYEQTIQIGSRNSKSEMLIQGATALNAGETENHSMDQLEAIHQREHKDARYFRIPEQVQDEDVSITKEKDCTNIGKGQSLLQCCNVIQIARLVFYKAMDPTLHYKVKAEEVYDGSGNGLANPM